MTETEKALLTALVDLVNAVDFGSEEELERDLQAARAAIKKFNRT